MNILTPTAEKQLRQRVEGPDQYPASDALLRAVETAYLEPAYRATTSIDCYIDDAYKVGGYAHVGPTNIHKDSVVPVVEALANNPIITKVTVAGEIVYRRPTDNSGIDYDTLRRLTA